MPGVRKGEGLGAPVARTELVGVAHKLVTALLLMAEAEEGIGEAAVGRTVTMLVLLIADSVFVVDADEALGAEFDEVAEA